MRYSFMPFAVVFAVCFGSLAAAAQPEYTVLSKQDHRRIAQLPNRMIIIAQRIETSPVVSVQAWIKTGSIFEQQHNGAGLSHFLEHLVSGGTTDTRTEAESNRILGQMGAQTNAATSLDTVRYYINTDEGHVETAIDLMSDWMQNSLIKQEEFARERQVIQREFDMGRGEPDRIFWKLTQQARYQVHPARHPTIGYLDEFLTISRDEIYNFYKTMYVPNNMVFVVVGDIDPARTIEQVAEQWADVEPGALPELKFPVEPELSRPVEVTGHADVSRPKLRLAWPGTRLGAEHDYALDLLAQVLGQGELSRLVQTVRNEQKLVTSIDAYNLSFAWGEGFFGVDATVADPTGQMTVDQRLGQVRDAVLEQVTRVRDQGVSEQELQRAKAKTLASVIYGAQTAEATASRLARDTIAMGDPDYLRRYAQAINKVTVEDLQAAARAVLEPDRLITVRLLAQTAQPAHQARPDDPQIDVDYEPVDLDNQRVIEALAERRQGDGDQRQVQVTDMKMVRLDNGLRVLLQRDSRLPIVAMQWYHLGGLLADDVGREGVANAMSSMMIKGAGDRTHEQIAALLESTGSSLATSCGHNTFYVSGLALSEHWRDLLPLMADVVIRPTFPEDQWRLMQPRLLAAIDSINDRWSSQLFNTFHQTYFGDHPWSQPVIGRRAVVEGLTVGDLKRFHARRIAGPKGVLAVVGDIDLDQAEALVREQFAGLADQAAVAFEAPRPEPVQDELVKQQIAKPLTAVQIGFGPGLEVTSPDYPAMVVMTRVVSNFPSGWLHQALRGEGPGLAYASWAFARSGIVPGYWTIAFNTDATTAGQAIQRSLALTERLQSEPVDAATLGRAKASALFGEVFGKQSNSQRATQAALDELYGVGYDHGRQMVEAIRKITAADIQRIARKYLAGDPLIVIISNAPDEATVAADRAEAAPAVSDKQ